MASELELQIQQHLLQYLNGHFNLSAFEDWFVPIFWGVDEEDAGTRELAGRIHILTSELSRGDRTLESFRQEIMNSVRPVAENRYGNPMLATITPESYASVAMNAAA